MRHRRAAALIFLILSGFSGYISLRFWPREPLLLERAHKVYKGVSTAWPHWINDHELLICRSGRYEPGQFFRCDIATGTEQPLPALNRSLSLHYNQHAALSPDGQWLLWDEGEHGGSPITAIRLDGSRQHRWAISNEGAMRWMGDSRHWVYFTNITHNEDSNVRGMTAAILYDALEPQHKSVIALPVAEQIGAPTFTLSGSLIELAEDWETEAELHVRGVTEWRFLPTVERLRHFEVHRPQPLGVDNIKIEEVAINHKGDRVVWAISGKRVLPPIARLLQRFWPGFSPSVTPLEMIWVTHLDGSHPQELGYLPLKAQDVDGTLANTSVGGVDDLRWLAGDRQISFMRRGDKQDEIYTISAN